MIDSIFCAINMASFAVCGRTPLARANKPVSPPKFVNKHEAEDTVTLARAERDLHLHKPYTLADAKHNWKRLCLKYHPDKGIHSDGDLFRRVKSAFEIIQEHMSMTTLVEVKNSTAVIELLTNGVWQSSQTDKTYKFVQQGEQLMIESRGWWREPVDLSYNNDVIKTGGVTWCGSFRGTVLRREIKSPDLSKGLGILRFTNDERWVQLVSSPPSAMEWSFTDLELGREDADMEDTVVRLLQDGLWEDDGFYEWVFRRQRFRKLHLDMLSKDRQDVVGDVEIVQGQLLLQFNDGSAAKVAVMRLDSNGKPVIVYLENEFGFIRSTPSRRMLGLRCSSKRKRGTRAGKERQAKYARR